jgi:outer membrane protein TolC
MLKRIAVLCILIQSADARCGEPRLITLDEALRRAVEASPDARAIALEVERERAEAGATGLWPNPELSLVREEAAGVVERFAQLSQTVPWSGRLALERSAARAGVRSAEATARQDLASLKARVHEAFIDLLLVQERAVALAAGRSRLADLVEVLRAREREGESSGFDRMRAERELAEVEADLIEERGRLARFRSGLAALVALPGEELTASGSLATAAAVPSRDALAGLLESRGDLAALEAAAERAELRARAARRRLVPEPSVTLGAKSAEAGGLEDTGPTAAIGLPLPFFDRGQEAASGRAEAALIRARRESLVRLAAAEAESLHAEVMARRDAETRYAATGDPENLIRIAMAAYEGGAMRILDVLDATRTALAARLRELELHAVARRAEVALGRALGVEVVP